MTIYSDALGKQSTFNTNLIAKLQELATAVGNRVRSADLYDGNGKIKSNFLCNIGYGDHGKLFDRSPRFAFDEVCTLA